MLGAMNRTMMFTWIAISGIVIGGFFGVMAFMLTHNVIVGDTQEWKFIEMMFGGLVTIFGQVVHSWMSWFVGPTHSEKEH